MSTKKSSSRKRVVSGKLLAKKRDFSRRSLATISGLLGVVGIAFIVYSHAAPGAKLLYVNSSGHITASSYDGAVQQVTALAGGQPVWANGRRSVLFDGYGVQNGNQLGTALFRSDTSGTTFGSPAQLTKIIAFPPVFLPIAWSEATHKLATVIYMKNPSNQLIGGTIMTANADGSGETAVAQVGGNGAHFTSVQWSPDGKTLLAGEETGTASQVVTVPAAGGSLHVVDAIGSSGLTSLPGRQNVWSADSSSVVLGYSTRSGNNYTYTLKKVNVVTGASKSLATITQSTLPNTNIQFIETVAPGGSRVAFGYAGINGLKVYTVSMSGGLAKTVWSTPSAGNQFQDLDSLVWAPDGSYLGYATISTKPDTSGGYTRGVYTVPSTGGAPRQIFSDVSSFDSQISWATK